MRVTFAETVCHGPDCVNRFVPHSGRHVYCSKRCAKIARNRQLDTEHDVKPLYACPRRARLAKLLGTFAMPVHIVVDEWPEMRGDARARWVRPGDARQGR